jgi:hypothetical protein
MKLVVSIDMCRMVVVNWDNLNHGLPLEIQ